jgi:hypothetical protein
MSISVLLCVPNAYTVALAKMTGCTFTTGNDRAVTKVCAYFRHHLLQLQLQEALIKLANFTILCKNETKDITTNKAS